MHCASICIVCPYRVSYVNVTSFTIHVILSCSILMCLQVLSSYNGNHRGFAPQITIVDWLKKIIKIVDPPH